MSKLQKLPFRSLLLLLPFVALSLASLSSDDKKALLEFKSSVTEDPLGFLSNWNPKDTNPCFWNGVTCDARSRRVVSLHLSSNASSCSFSLSSGNPNPNSISFPCLGFDLHDENKGVSKLKGKLSPSIGKLAQLRVLSLGFNGFSGRLPLEIGNLRFLEILDLGFNNFQGEIPLSIANCIELQEVSFAGNQLNGTVPAFFAGFRNLRTLSLSFNVFTGMIPKEFGENCSVLEHLHLAGNHLLGSIPPNLGNCSRLRSLILFSNKLENGIPPDLGRLQMLESLDVSRNSLSGVIPSDLGNCKQLELLVLKNDYHFSPVLSQNESNSSIYSEEFNFFGGKLLDAVVSLPNLRVLWAPSLNLEGTFPQNWGSCTRLQMVNLARNYFTGEIPASLRQCKSMYFLDLSSNRLSGRLYEEIPVPCMVMFNVSGNSFSGLVPNFLRNGCPETLMNLSQEQMGFSGAYSSLFYKAARMSVSVLPSSDNPVIFHDFSYNQFAGPLPLMPISPGWLAARPLYGFLLSNNNFEGNMSEYPFDLCTNLDSLVVNFSDNRIFGELPWGMGSHCKCMKQLDLAGNAFVGSIPPSFAFMDSLISLDLSRNKLQGQIPIYFGKMKDMRYLSLSENKFTGKIPRELAQLRSLEVLELSSNFLSGEIPNDFTKLGHITVLKLDNNALSGQIPKGFSNMTSLSLFNVSFNNLSGSLPPNLNLIKCENVQGNPNLQPCRDGLPSSSSDQHSNVSQPTAFSPTRSVPRKGNLNPIEIASIVSASAIVSVLVALVLLLTCLRKHVSNTSVQGSGRKEVVTCNNIGVQLTYENVVKATGNFSVQNCIGNGGFGATYKAEVIPGVVVAVKRLSIGRFQGDQQFGAEIRTLGRVQHPNLVTLIGYHVSEAEMFLIYNYLPGGNLERFIQDRLKRAVDWSMLHKIALDIARALAYLHDECVPRVLHRDIKPSNILLDKNYNAYLSDFGLARLLGTSETHATTDVAGTFGYVAPEYAMTCRVSDKADVYSYGVVLLELISDKKALDPSFSCYGNGFSIVAWASMLLKQGRAREFFTAGLWDVGPHDDLIETLRLAVVCTGDSLSTRPSMKQVAQRLKRIQPPTC